LIDGSEQKHSQTVPKITRINWGVLKM